MTATHTATQAQSADALVERIYAQGAGHGVYGGYEAALVAAQLGADVTVVERHGLGGAAVLTDVVPSKTLIATAEVSAGALDQVDTLARGLVRGSNDFAGQPVEIGGPLTLLKLLKDPDINRALSFFATVARAVGRELKQA